MALTVKINHVMKRQWWKKNVKSNQKNVWVYIDDSQQVKVNENEPSPEELSVKKIPSWNV